MKNYNTLDCSYYESLIYKIQDTDLSLEERVNAIAEVLTIDAADELYYLKESDE